MQAQPQPNRQQPQRNRQIIYIIVVYLVLTMFSRFTSDSASFSKSVISMISNPDGGPIPVKTIMGLFTVENYAGQWKAQTAQTFSVLSNGFGSSRVKIQKIGNSQGMQYQFQFKLNNGQYIDNGDVIIRAVINAQKLQSTREGTTCLVNLKQPVTNSSEKPITAFFRQQKILQTVQQKLIQINDFSIKIQYISLQKSLKIDVTLHSSQNLQAVVRIEKQQSTMFSTIIFAVLLFLISYVQFSAVMEMLKAIFEGRQSAHSYSLFTILVATMWDAVICVVAFIEAFSNQESLILFIMPAFLLCLLFTNLELRILMMIFQDRSENRNMREIVCKFNVVTYGSIILMYPLLIFTNLNSFFFLAISLIMVPQIYWNALQGQRPDISNAYYSKFLTFRFLLILYLKCFPWNIFDLEPNYLLSFTCISLLAFQLFLLWAQKQYGPKKVLPRFLLPPIYNYGCDNDINIEEGAQAIECAICLAPLHSDPEPDGNNNNLNLPFRLMRGPCGHKFHGACLSQWMRIKMQCPQCRRKLPPFQ